MRVLVACESSGRVRDAFRAAGHDAVSCDVLPTEAPGPHIEGDVLPHLADGWDMIVAFPPCTHLAVSGARHFAAKRADGRQQEGIAFFLAIAAAPVAKLAIENPVGIMSSLYRKPDQVIQPWQFGHGETKATCLWLRGLPPLVPTDVVPGREARVHRMPPSPDRWKQRSATYPGIASAMAAQWGGAPFAALPLFARLVEVGANPAAPTAP
jgi:hypothetical protein